MGHTIRCQTKPSGTWLSVSSPDEPTGRQKSVGASPNPPIAGRRQSGKAGALPLSTRGLIGSKWGGSGAIERYDRVGHLSGTRPANGSLKPWRGLSWLKSSVHPTWTRLTILSF